MAIDVQALVEGCLRGQHPLDNPAINENLPAPCDIRWFQRKLDQIMGKELNGKSRCRLVWGMDMERARVWDHYHRQWRASYPLHKHRETELFVPARLQKWRDIGTPRWFIERYIPPDIACIGWQVSGFDSEGIEYFDPAPVDGLYESFFDGQLANHDPNQRCCELARSLYKPCIGYYREPDEYDLTIIRGLKQITDREKERRPGPSTPEELEKSRLKAEEAYAAWSDELERSITPNIADALKTHQYSLSDDPGVVSHGGFHFMSGHNRSGSKTEGPKE